MREKSFFILKSNFYSCAQNKYCEESEPNSLSLKKLTFKKRNMPFSVRYMFIFYSFATGKSVFETKYTRMFLIVPKEKPLARKEQQANFFTKRNSCFENFPVRRKNFRKIILTSCHELIGFSNLKAHKDVVSHSDWNHKLVRNHPERNYHTYYHT